MMLRSVINIGMYSPMYKICFELDATQLNKIFWHFAGRLCFLQPLRSLMAIGTIIGHGLDFPYSPIRLIILTLPLDVSETILDAARLSAGVTFVI